MIATLSKQFLNKRHCRLQSVDNAVKATMQTLFHTSQKNEQINASNRPAGYRMGWTRNVIAELLPFTSELISGRGRPLENIAVAYCVATPVMDIIDPLPGQIATQRRVEDSWMELILPFSDQSLLRDSMVTSDGSTIRFGKLFEILDSFAADVACRHCCGRSVDGQHIVAVVTASVDELMTCANIDVANDLKLQSYVTYVGKSSMEVTIDMISVNPDGSEIKVGDTQFIMVARDPATGKASKVHALYLPNDDTKEKFARGQQRAAIRMSKASESLSRTSPKIEEVDVIHKLYLASKEVKMQKEAIINAYLWTPMEGLKGDIGNKNIRTKNAIPDNEDHSSHVPSIGNPVPTRTATSLLPMIGNESLRNQLQHYRRNLKWMKNTKFSNTLYMHPQERNIHGNIFGGYLMKEAFELAWISATCFFGGQTPTFKSVDNILFVLPVAIGSVMEFTATVVYSQDLYIVVQVDAFKVNPTTNYRSRTNVLSYVFHAPMDAEYIRQVMPSEYDEFVLYLEGRRCMEDYLTLSQDSNQS